MAAEIAHTLFYAALIYIFASSVAHVVAEYFADLADYLEGFADKKEETVLMSRKELRELLNK